MTENETQTIRGVVTEFQAKKTRKGTDYMRLVLKGEKIPFFDWNPAKHADAMIRKERSFFRD